MGLQINPDRRTVLSGLATSLSLSLVPAIAKAITTQGDHLPAVGLGSWITFNVGDDPVGLANSQAVIAAFLEDGGRLIDSSPMYGSSQVTIGKALANLQPGSQLYAADKIWTRRTEQGRSQAEQSARNWQIDSFDLLQVHNLLSWEAHLETLHAMKADGQVRAIGVTTSHGRRHRELEQIMSTQDIDFVQLTYNLDNREAESRLLPLAHERDIRVIANRPYDGGSLIKRLKRHSVPAWATEAGIRSWADFALGYIISHPAMSVAIPATTRVDHVRENVAAARLTSLEGPMRGRILDHFRGL